MPKELLHLRDRVERAMRENDTLEEWMVDLKGSLRKLEVETEDMESLTGELCDLQGGRVPMSERVDHERGRQRRSELELLGARRGRGVKVWNPLEPHDERNYCNAGSRGQSKIDLIAARTIGLADELGVITDLLGGMQESMHRQDAVLCRVYKEVGLKYTRNPYANPGFDVQPVAGGVEYARNPYVDAEPVSCFRAQHQSGAETLDPLQRENLHGSAQLDRVALRVHHMMRALDGLEIGVAAHQRALGMHVDALGKAEAVDALGRAKRRAYAPPRYEGVSDTYAGAPIWDEVYAPPRCEEVSNTYAGPPRWDEVLFEDG